LLPPSHHPLFIGAAKRRQQAAALQGFAISRSRLKSAPAPVQGTLLEAKVLDFGGSKDATPDQFPDQFAAIGALAAFFVAGAYLLEKVDGIQALIVEVHQVGHCDGVQVARHQFEKISIPTFI
jgi:hypothetical protein